MEHSGRKVLEGLKTICFQHGILYLLVLVNVWCLKILFWKYSKLYLKLVTFFGVRRILDTQEFREERERENTSPICWFTALNAHSVWDWMWPNLGARNAVQVSQVNRKNRWSQSGRQASHPGTAYTRTSPMTRPNACPTRQSVLIFKIPLEDMNVFFGLMPELMVVLTKFLFCIWHWAVYSLFGFPQWFTPL